MIGKLAWKNIWFRPLNTLLSVLLLTASVAIITVLILVEKQFEEKYQKNLDGIQMVLGAQGSPLQLVLSSVYMADVPTGNISYDSVKTWMNHPYVKKAIPLAYGDNYLGYKIVGTTKDYISKFNGTFSEGMVFQKNLEVVLGSEVAEKTKLKIGDNFKGTHGDAIEGEVHEHADYKVVGILKPTGKVIDNVIISNIPSVWQMHEEGHDHEEHAANSSDEEHAHDENEEGHVHDENCNHEHDEAKIAEEKTIHVHDSTCEHVHEMHETDININKKGMEITAVLIEFRNKLGTVMWPRLIAQNTKMQAALPTYEMNKLFDNFGVGLQALKFLAYGIMLISGISIFIALYNSLKERKYEFAIMRVNGASKWTLLSVVLFESLLLCITGFIFGTILGRIGIIALSKLSEKGFKLAFNPLEIIWQKEGILFAITLLIGILAALIPAVKAYKLNISKTLANA